MGKGSSLSLLGREQNGPARNGIAVHRRHLKPEPLHLPEAMSTLLESAPAEDAHGEVSADEAAAKSITCVQHVMDLLRTDNKVCAYFGSCSGLVATQHVTTRP
jgi:hypothetical protein